MTPEKPRPASAPRAKVLTPKEVLEEVRRLGLATPSGAAALVREDRDHR